MPIFNANQIYFGNFADMDPTEASSSDINNTVNEFQTVSGFGTGVTFNKTTLSIIAVAQNDTVREGNINKLESNDFQARPLNPLNADTYTYDLGAGTTTSEIDSFFIWNVAVTLGDNTSSQMTLVFVQLTNGDVFSHDATQLDGLNIQSIRLVSYVGGDYYGAGGSRSIDGSRIVCFAEGTMIATPGGDIPIEKLRVGDLITTADNGSQPIAWIGSRKVTTIELAHSPKLRPICIQAGALCENTPRQNLIVSPQHRILANAALTKRMFAQDEVLLPAKHLLELGGIAVLNDLEPVTYWHFACHAHQVIFANDTATESMLIGSESLKAMSQEAREEIHTIFSALYGGPKEAMPSARVIAKGSKAKHFVARLHKNRKSLVVH
ncbi:Hint domain-containing protein [Nereida ignava]|uniref:Hint domain-containing protein n=1 Tax=Nereida ignava TaxID=282199 RepID=UPI003F6ABDD1